MLLQIVEAENACIAAQNLGAGDSPDQLGGGVEMADKAITIDDDHGIVRPLERRQQELGTFDRWTIAGAHYATLGLAGGHRRSRAAMTWAASISLRECSECLCDPVPPGGIDIMLKIQLVLLGRPPAPSSNSNEEREIPSAEVSSA
jgi:hypothetical protein